MMEKTTHGVGIKETSDVERASSVAKGCVSDLQEKEQLRVGLEQRHIQMIALAGTIGTGLFLGSGKAIADAGPFGALLAYTLIGSLVTAPLLSVAEMSALVPLSGGIIRHAEYFCDPAMSFAIGWNGICSCMVALPAEMAAAAVLTEFWTTSVNNAVFITIFGLLLVASNIFLVRVYGELEYGFAWVKILLVVGVNLMALVLISGGGPTGHVYGVQYWKFPGPFVQYDHIEGGLGRFAGFWTALNNAVYAFAGVGSITLAASETKNPRRNIPKAAKRIFWRVLIFYVMSIFFVGLLVPSDDPHLLASGAAVARSPFVIAAQRAGNQIVPNILNAGILLSAWSSGNTVVLSASRVLFGLAQERRAPRIFTRVSRFGIPYVCVIFVASSVCFAYTSLSHGAATVFTWFQSICAIAILVDCCALCCVYLRFYAAFKAQDISRDRLPWKAPGQPYLALVGLIWAIILLVTGGWHCFINGGWDVKEFITKYINIPLFLVLYFGYKLAKRTKLVALKESPILKFIEIAEQNPEPHPKPKKGWQRLNLLWS